MSRVRFPSPAPTLKPAFLRWFCCRFCRLCSAFVEALNNFLRCCGPIHVPPNDPAHVHPLPTHDFGNHSFWEAGNVESGCCRYPQIVKMQIAAGEPRVDLGLVELTAEAVECRWPIAAICKNSGRAVRYGCQNLLEVGVQRYDRPTTMFAFFRWQLQLRRHQRATMTSAVSRRGAIQGMRRRPPLAHFPSNKSVSDEKCPRLSKSSRND